MDREMEVDMEKIALAAIALAVTAAIVVPLGMEAVEALEAVKVALVTIR